MISLLVEKPHQAIIEKIRAKIQDKGFLHTLILIIKKVAIFFDIIPYLSVY